MRSSPSIPILSKPLLVLDTNVVLDLLHFEDAIAYPILAALQHEQVKCVATEATLEELRRVLTYPEFKLASVRQATLLDQYLRLVRMQDTPPTSVELPICSDPDDQKFLELAASSHAHTLVSKDRAVLKLRWRCAAHFQVMTPAEAGRWLADVNSGSAAET